VTERDFEQLLRAGFRQMVDEAAPPALRASVIAIPDLVPSAAPRRPTAEWSLPRLNRFATFALAATVVVAVLIGIGLLARAPTVGPSPVPIESGGPSPTPTATPIPRAASWTVTGSMITPRAQLTATLLTNGKVLVAGGNSGTYSALSSAELYDPTSGAWSATGSLITPRMRHTATLLLDGRVLVAGGRSVVESLASAELYDPRTGRWSATGSMLHARQNHAAILLADGRVLVVGGAGRGDPAELYDPGSGTWNETEPTKFAYLVGYQTPMRLADGTVLIIGDGPAELYSPDTGGWTLPGGPHSTGEESSATLLADGRVLISGGENQSGSVFTPRLSAQLYDPTTGTSTATGSMKSRAAFAPGFLLADGTVLVVGGGGLADRYDPRTGTWLATGGPTLAGGSSSYPGPDFAATLLANGMVLVAGGLDDSGRLASVELYDPGAGS
jgi:hypothetical protein